MRASRLVLFVLLGVLLAQIVFYFPILPARMATHFDAAGQADGWMSKESFAIFEFFLLLVVIAEFTLLPLAMEKMPASLINLPNKDYWLAPERRAETFLGVRKYFEWFSVGLLSLFIAINQLVIRANLDGRDLPSGALWLILGAFFVFVGVWLVKFIRRFKMKI